MSADALTSGPLVVFVGAGASSIAPSSLPGWFDFNTTLLECLCEQVAGYSRMRQRVDTLLAAIKAKRDTTPFLPPDFQAQLMEEEIGAEYFRVWQSLDTEVYGPVHAGLAELAANGRIAAIVTTNFDRLLEVALSARGVPHSVYHNQASFEALASAPTSASLPVIKIHGSIEDADSLVDTLRQRLTGRSPALTEALHTLLTRHQWMFLGFSGADFSYDPNYLGISDAANDARGFTFVTRPGAMVQPGVRALAERYGAKGAVVEGALPEWLLETFCLTHLTTAVAGDRTAEPVRREVHDRVSAWVASLGPLAAVNILCAMLRSIGLDDHAHWLLRRTWRSYRTPEDTRAGASYDRYNHNYGLSLLQHGFVGNRVARADDMSNFLEWRAAADQDAWQFFARAWQGNTLFVAGAQQATCMAYLGRVGEAMNLGSDVLTRAHASGQLLAVVDVLLALAPLYDMANEWEARAPLLAASVRLAKDLGDEPRRALALVHLGRALCVTGQFDFCREILQKAEGIARRLALPEVALHCRMLRGRLTLDSEQSDRDALAMLQGVVHDLRARMAAPLYTHVDLGDPDALPTAVTGVSPTLCRALLDLNRAACFAGDGDVMTATLRELHDLAGERFPGYEAHVIVAHGQCLLYHGTGSIPDRIADCVADLHDTHRRSGNPWALSGAKQLTDLLARATGSQVSS